MNIKPSVQNVRNCSLLKVLTLQDKIPFLIYLSVFFREKLLHLGTAKEEVVCLRFIIALYISFEYVNTPKIFK